LVYIITNYISCSWFIFIFGWDGIDVVNCNVYWLDKELNMKRELSETVKYILKMQCKFVNADYDTLDFVNDESEWYKEFEWTKEQEEDFKIWLILYLKTCPMKNYREISTSPRRVKNYKTIANEWCFLYGWSYKKEK